MTTAGDIFGMISLFVATKLALAATAASREREVDVYEGVRYD
jgi:hypothetical protein